MNNMGCFLFILKYHVHLVLMLGTILVRKLTKLPKNKCWLVGSSKSDAIDVAINFNKSWETDLRVGYHDCRDYTDGTSHSLSFLFSIQVHTLIFHSLN